MLQHYPLVSCICISHNDVRLLRRSIECFFEQTYPNKEMVIIYPHDNISTRNYLDNINDPLIKRIEIEPNRFTLGEKRNLAIEKSEGFYFCVWDDDDWYHQDRITFHVQRLKDTQFKCSVLSRLIIFDSLKNEAYLSGKRWAWEQTLLCEKTVTNDASLRYANVERGEDSVFVFNLREKDLLLTISNPSLYIYVYHGQNTWHRKHWEENLIRWATKLSNDQSSMIQKILKGDYSNTEACEIIDGMVKELPV